MEPFPQTKRNRVKRKPDRRRYDKATIYLSSTKRCSATSGLWSTANPM